LRIDARRGVSLVELMISMLILVFVTVTWMKLIGAQSARRESFRREAVERLAGMMDAFLLEKRNEFTSLGTGGYRLVKTGDEISFTKDASSQEVHEVFEERESASPIGYRLQVVTKDGLANASKFGSAWSATDDPDKQCKWVVGSLYDRVDEVTEKDRFFTLQACLGF